MIRVWLLELFRNSEEMNCYSNMLIYQTPMGDFKEDIQGILHEVPDFLVDFIERLPGTKITYLGEL